jgi:hypothetical protein
MLICRFPATVTLASVKFPWLASTLEDPAKNPEVEGLPVGDAGRERFTNKSDELDEIISRRPDSCMEAFRLRDCELVTPSFDNIVVMLSLWMR